MNRFHVHLNVADLDASIRFYSELFAAQPAVLKPDYAKWMLDDPRVNFAISTRGREPGLDHLGIQVESADELQKVYSSLQHAGGAVLEEGQTTCCYAKSEKSWTDDPAGISWEAFHTTGESTHYGTSIRDGAQIACAKACCEPQPAAQPEPSSACCKA
jgi:predicted enzyme related to lactoylglutathione lyase